MTTFAWAATLLALWWRPAACLLLVWRVLVTTLAALIGIVLAETADVLGILVRQEIGAVTWDCLIVIAVIMAASRVCGRLARLAQDQSLTPHDIFRLETLRTGVVWLVVALVTESCVHAIARSWGWPVFGELGTTLFVLLLEFLVPAWGLALSRALSVLATMKPLRRGAAS